MQQPRNHHLTATAIRTVLALSLSGTRLLLCSGEWYLICKSSPKHLTSKVIDALTGAGWISHPEEIGAGIAECQITPQGKSTAERIRQQMSTYCQLLLFEKAEGAA
jgi:hypothetical protein